MKVRDKRGVRICYFGTYSMEDGYPRNRVIIDGLRRNGVDIIECHEDFWKDTSQKLEGVKVSYAMLITFFRLLSSYGNLIRKFRQVGYYDAIIVGYAGHFDIFLAKLLNLFRRMPVVFDAFLSLYDTLVMDRRIVSPGSLKAKLLWLMDRWSCRMADVVLMDTQAHVDYFVREFRLPAEKFHAVPVGSFIKVHEDPPQSPFRKWGSSLLPPPLEKGGQGGFDRRFTVLYFGAYIPLHGVEVILEAAKIIQEKGNRLPSVIPAEAGIQNAGKGLDSHFRGNDDIVENCSDGSKIIFTLVGTGQLLPEMKELAASLVLRNVIFIERFVSEEELVGYIQQADICLGIFGQTEKAARVIPCKVYNCLAMGKPLITMSSQATEGVLTHRENAFLCKPGDPAALAEAILSLKNDKTLREEIAHKGQEYFEKNFSADAIGKKVVEVIGRLLKKSARLSF